MINRANYEIYFLDYFENRLSEMDCKLLQTFLDENPDLKSEFYSFENIILNHTSESFPLKSQLKKAEISDADIHTYLIAECENDLNDEEQKALNHFIQLNPQYKIERQLYKKARLLPIPVVFEKKALLLKSEITINSSNVNEFLIREIENDLTSAEAELLNKFIAAHPELAGDRKLFAASRLWPDKVEFPHKGILKKTRSIYRPDTLRYLAGIAAIILFVAGIIFINQTPDSKSRVAVNKPVIKSEYNAVHKKFSADSLNGVKTKVNRKDLILPVTTSPQRILLASEDKTGKQHKSSKQKPGKINITEKTLKPVDTITKFLENKPTNQDAIKTILPLAENSISKDQVENKQPLNQPEVANNEELTLGQALNKMTKSKLEQITGTTNEFPDDPTMNKQRKWLDRTAWLVNKIGGNKVKMTNKFTTSNDLMNTELTAGTFSIEHVSGQ